MHHTVLLQVNRTIAMMSPDRLHRFIFRALFCVWPLLLTGAAVGDTTLPPAVDVNDLAPPNFETFGSKDGLPDEIISTMGVDPLGFVWAGTASSLYRFDGYGWIHKPIPGASSLVRHMVSTPDTLWAIFERQGLAWTDGHGWRLTGDDTFRHRFSTTRDPDGNETYWLTGASGPYRLHDNRQWLPDPGWSQRLRPCPGKRQRAGQRSCAAALDRAQCRWTAVDSHRRWRVRDFTRRANADGQLRFAQQPARA